MRSRSLHPRPLVLLSFVVLLAATPQAAAAPGDNPSQCERRENCQPDLQVKSVTANRQMIVRSRPGETIRLRHEVENAGDGGADPSKTRLLLKAGEGVFALRTSVNVPKLDAGDSKQQTVKASLPNDEVAINRYRLIACADWKKDVKESKEGNNCERGKYVTVVPWKLSGEVHGEYKQPLSGFTESWSGSNIVFETTPGQKRPNYFPTAGTLDYQVSGTDAFGCTYTGGGTIGPLDPIEGILELQLNLNSYKAIGELDIDRYYEYNFNCPNQEPGVSSGPTTDTWLASAPQESTGFGNLGNFPDRLSGSVRFDSSSGDSLSSSWDLVVE